MPRPLQLAFRLLASQPGRTKDEKDLLSYLATRIERGGLGDLVKEEIALSPRVLSRSGSRLRPTGGRATGRWNGRATEVTAHGDCRRGASGRQAVTGEEIIAELVSCLENLVELHARQLILISKSLLLPVD